MLIYLSSGSLSNIPAWDTCARTPADGSGGRAWPLVEGASPGADGPLGRFSDREVIFTTPNMIAALLVIPCVPLEGRMALGGRGAGLARRELSLPMPSVLVLSVPGPPDINGCREACSCPKAEPDNS